MKKPYPKHKGSGLPSTSFLRGAFKRHLDQRITVEFVPNEAFKPFLKEAGIDVDKPVYICGIFMGFWKKRGPQGGSFSSEPMEIFIRLASVVWKQDDKTLFDPMGRKNRKQRRSEWQFRASNFRGLNWNLKPNVPQIEQTKRLRGDF